MAEVAVNDASSTAMVVSSTVMSSAPRLAEIIAARPHVFDGMLDPGLLAELPTKDYLAPRIANFVGGARHYEEVLDRLRIIAAEQRFLFGIRLLTGAISGAQAGRAFTDLADLIIAAAVKAVQDEIRSVHGEIPGGRIAVVGMGKLGSHELTAGSDVDLILLDLSMPGISGFSGLIYLRAQYSAIPVVVVSASDDVATIRRSMDFGASGFIPKRLGVEALRTAILKVIEGDVWIPPDVDLSAATDPDMARLRDRIVTLTPQQVRVLMMLSEGLLNKQIAYELGVSEATIKAHVSAILQKLGVESRTQAVIAAARIAGDQWRQSEPSAN